MPWRHYLLDKYISILLRNDVITYYISILVYYYAMTALLIRFVY